MARKSFNPGTLLVPLPAVMATVGNMENSNIITIGWTGILSSDPARTYISVRPSRYSHKLLSENPEFVINLTTEELAYATDYAGIYTGAKVDKFEKLGLTKIASEKVKAPTIAESPLAIECKVFDVLHFGTHDVFMADIVNVTVRDELLDEKGKICIERAGLIAYAHGEYYSLGKRIGKFGFSAVKHKGHNSKKNEPKSEKGISKAEYGVDTPSVKEKARISGGASKSVAVKSKKKVNNRNKKNKNTKKRATGAANPKKGVKNEK